MGATQQVLASFGVVAPAGTAYRWYRIYITANNGDATYTGIGDVQLRLTAGGANQSTNPANASASTQFAAAPGNGSAYQAFDGTLLTTNGWATTGGSAVPSWLKYDFGAGNAKIITQAALWNQLGQTTRNPKDFVFEGSNDNSAWTNVGTFAGITGWTDNVAKLFTLTP